MKDECLFKQLAEIRALTVTNLFVNQTMLENMGADPEVLLKSVDGMIGTFAHTFENEMRVAHDLEPIQPQPKVANDPLRNIPWSRMKEQ